MELEDVERLEAFVKETRADLEDIFFKLGRRYLSGEVDEHLLPAWDTLLGRDEFGQLLQALRNRNYDDRLERAGLSGSELHLKRVGLEAARSEAQARPTRRRLKRWLKWINVILGSLVAATGLGEGIKELKEVVETDLEPRDWRRR